MNNRRYFDVAGLGMTIEGNNEWTAEYWKYFSSIEVEEELELTFLNIRIVNEINIIERYTSLSQAILFNENEFMVKKGDYIYKIKNLFGQGMTIIEICHKNVKNLPHKIKNIIGIAEHATHSIKEGIVNHIMGYDFMLWVIPVALMKYNRLFLHCGAMEKDGKAVIITGTSGSGKTGTQLLAMSDYGYRYMADDFCILSTSGMAYYFPKKIKIYQSDIKYKNKFIYLAYKKLPITKRINWQILKKMNKDPRGEFYIEKVFKTDEVVKSAHIGKIIYVARTNSKAINEYRIEDREFSRRTRLASFREIRELYNILSNICSVGDERIRECYPEWRELEEKYEEIMMKILSNSFERRLLEVPEKIHPGEIIKVF